MKKKSVKDFFNTRKVFFVNFRCLYCYIECCIVHKTTNTIISHHNHVRTRLGCNNNSYIKFYILSLTLEILLYTHSFSTLRWCLIATTASAFHLNSTSIFAYICIHTSDYMKSIKQKKIVKWKNFLFCETFFFLAKQQEKNSWMTKVSLIDDISKELCIESRLNSINYMNYFIQKGKVSKKKVSNENISHEKGKIKMAASWPWINFIQICCCSCRFSSKVKSEWEKNFCP